MSKKVLIALSGGVDSSMSVKLLLEKGYELNGVYMKLHNNEEYHKKNIEKVQKVAKFFGIKAEILDFTEIFNEKVYKPFVEIYKNGQTPNPCAFCNKNIKFGELFSYAKKNGFDFLATGHYARIFENKIKVAVDLSKDQSYFLANIDPKIIPNLIFPLGEFYKTQIKEMAANIPEICELSTQKESSEICFVPNSYTEILEKHFQIKKEGKVKNLKGDIIGKHFGYANYTIGKRSGFRIDGAHEPHYVVKIDAKNNEIIVGKKEDLAINEIYLQNLKIFDENFIKDGEILGFCKVRYRSEKTQIKLTINDKKIEFSKPVFGVASGQLAVIYDENDCIIASGFIN